MRDMEQKSMWDVGQRVWDAGCGELKIWGCEIQPENGCKMWDVTWAIRWDVGCLTPHVTSPPEHGDPVDEEAVEEDAPNFSSLESRQATS